MRILSTFEGLNTVLKKNLLLFGFWLLLVGAGGCDSKPAVVDPDQLSAEEAEKLRVANEEYEAYMNE